MDREIKWSYIQKDDRSRVILWLIRWAPKVYRIIIIVIIHTTYILEVYRIQFHKECRKATRKRWSNRQPIQYVIDFDGSQVACTMLKAASSIISLQTYSWPQIIWLLVYLAYSRHLCKKNKNKGKIADATFGNSSKYSITLSLSVCVYVYRTTETWYSFFVVIVPISHIV